MKPSYIYVMTDEEQFVSKIGISDHPVNRRNQLQTGNPNILSLYFCLQAKPDFVSALEKILHSSLSSKRLSGEWFYINPEIATRILTNTAVFLQDYLKENGTYPVSLKDIKKHRFKGNNNFSCTCLRGFRSITSDDINRANFDLM